MTWRRIASTLWFPAFFAVVLPVTFQVVYHQPEPHKVPIGVVGSAGQVRAVASRVERVRANGFEVRELGSLAAATTAVRDRRVAAAYVGGAPTAAVYLARAASPLRATFLQTVFARAE